MTDALAAPLFSIITVTFENRAGLERTGRSLAAQSFQGFEWLVIDGGSTDGSVEFLDTTNAAWISEPDDGIYDAMNKGIERAGVLFLLFLNAGDELAGPEVLAELAAYIGERDLLPDFIYGDSREGGHYKPAKPYSKRTEGMFTHHQAMLYRREALGDLRYDTAYKIAADYDFTCRFLARNNRVLYWPQPVCLFEPGGISQQKVRLGRTEQFRIRKTLSLVSLPVNCVIYMVQSLLWSARTLCPGLYWRIKSSGNNAND